MSAPATHMTVLAGGRFACVKIQGRANFNASLDFNSLVTQLRERGFSYFIIELSECALMDSTFLGVLAGLGLKMNPDNTELEARHVELLNANPRITELLENVGVLHLFKSTDGQLASPEKLEACALEHCQSSRVELTRACLEAHETLMAVNPENVARFKDVTKFLAEDLARIKADGS